MLRAEGKEGTRQNEYAEIAAAFGAAAATQAQTSAAAANHVPIVPTPQTPYPPAQQNSLTQQQTAAGMRRLSRESNLLCDLMASRDNMVVVDVGDGRRPSLIISSSPPPPLLGAAGGTDQQDPSEEAWATSSEATKNGFDDDPSSAKAFLSRPSNLLTPLQPEKRNVVCAPCQVEVAGNDSSVDNNSRSREKLEDRNTRLREELLEMSELLRLTGRQHTEV